MAAEGDEVEQRRGRLVDDAAVATATVAALSLPLVLRIAAPFLPTSICCRLQSVAEVLEKDGVERDRCGRRLLCRAELELRFAEA